MIDNHKKAVDKPEGKEHPKNNSGEEERPPQTPLKPAEGKKPVEQEPPPDSQKPKPANNGKTVPKPPAKAAPKPAGTGADDSEDAPQ